MIRMIAVQEDATLMAAIGKELDISYRTFDVELPELEAYLRDDSNVHCTQCGRERATAYSPCADRLRKGVFGSAQITKGEA